MLLISKDVMIEDVTISRVHKFAHEYWFDVDVGFVVNDADG